MDPAARNKRALNRACVIRWKNASVGRLRPRLLIITPNWERVDKAIIFFISDSVKAAVPAINMVIDAIINKE